MLSQLESAPIADVTVFVLALVVMLNFFRVSGDVLHDFALKSRGHGDLLSRALLALFPVPRSGSARVRLRRQSRSTLDALGDILPFHKALNEDVAHHPWRISIMHACEQVLSVTIATLMCLPLTDLLRDLAVQTTILALGVRLVVPLASSSRLLADELFNITHIAKDDSLRMGINALGGLFEGLVWLLGSALVGSIMGFNMSSTFTGLGLGGVALAFSMQKSLEALASTFVLLMDKPFIVGDRVTLASGEKGVVEHIGIRSSHIRVLGENELMIVPNAELANQKIRNRTRCENRRVECVIEVDSSTSAASLAMVKSALERAVREAPYVLRLEGVGVLELGGGRWGGIVFEIVFFLTAGDTPTLRAARHAFFVNAALFLSEINVRLQRPMADVSRHGLIVGDSAIDSSF